MGEVYNESCVTCTHGADDHADGFDVGYVIGACMVKSCPCMQYVDPKPDEQ